MGEGRGGGVVGFGGGGGDGGGGAVEGEVEHEVSGCEVGGRAGEVEGQGYVVGLEGGEGCGEGDCAVGVAVSMCVPQYEHQQLLPPLKEKTWKSPGTDSEAETEENRRTQTANARPAPRCFAAHSYSRRACKLRSRHRRGGRWQRRRGRCRGRLAGRAWRRRRGRAGGLFPGSFNFIFSLRWVDGKGECLTMALAMGPERRLGSDESSIKLEAWFVGWLVGWCTC